MLYLWIDPDQCCFTFLQAFPILFDIIKEAPAFGQAYYHLALVPDNLGKTDSLSTEALMAAAYIKGPKSHVWKLLYDRAK